MNQPPVPTFFGLAVATERMVSVLTELMSAGGGRLAPGSPAALATASEDYPGAHPWTDEPHRDAFDTAMLMIPGAGECLRSMCDALLVQRPTAADVLARVSVESAARVSYLMDRRLDQRERVRRFSNEKLVALHESVSLFGSMPGMVVPDTYRDDIRVLLDEGKRHGFDVTPKPRGKFTAPYIGRQRPSSGALVDAMFVDAIGWPPGVGWSFYRNVSANPHAALHGHFLLYQQVGDNRVRLGVTPPLAALKLQPAVLAYRIMGNEVVYQLGLEPSVLWTQAAGEATSARSWGRALAPPLSDAGGRTATVPPASEV